MSSAWAHGSADKIQPGGGVVAVTTLIQSITGLAQLQSIIKNIL